MSNLEKISWEDGKFVDSEGNVVNPNPIGNCRTLHFDSSCHTVNDKLKVIFSEGHIINANAYNEGECIRHYQTDKEKNHTYVSIQFYKI